MLSTPEENLIRKVDAVMGSQTPQRRTIIDGLFGDGGAAASTDVVTFDSCVERYRKTVLSSAPPDIKHYVDNRIIQLLRLNVMACRTEWTNNSAESINHVLKQAVQWRPQQLPDLIGKLRVLVTSQFIEADCALCGRGDFFLSPTHAKHRLTVDTWKNMSSAQCHKAAQAYFKLAAAPASMSTDGTLSVPLTPGAGKKPHQRKRPRVDKSTTVTTKSTKVDDSDSDFA